MNMPITAVAHTAGRREMHLEVTVDDIAAAASNDDLETMLVGAAEKSGYMNAIDVPWSFWHYGKHAEVAASMGMDKLSELLSEGWHAELRLLSESFPRPVEHG